MAKKKKVSTVTPTDVDLLSDDMDNAIEGVKSLDIVEAEPVVEEPNVKELDPSDPVPSPKLRHTVYVNGIKVQPNV